MKVLHLLLLACALAPSSACSSDREPTTAEIVSGLQRSERSYMGLDRLEFTAAVEHRMQEVHRLAQGLYDERSIDEATLDDVEARLARIDEGVLDLRLHDGPDWETRRNSVADLAQDLEADVVKLATDDSET